MQTPSSNIRCRSYLSGNASTAKAIAWVDASEFEHVLIHATAAALTGAGLTVFEIRASASSSGTDAVVIAEHSLTPAPDAAGDQVFLETSAEKIRQAGVESGKNLRYVSAWIRCANAADNVVVTYVLCSPRVAKSGLTQNVVA